MKLKYIILALKDQGPWPRMVKNIKNGNILGIFYKRSHLTRKGNPKVGYNTKASALKACQKMSEKTGAIFDSYRCMWCGKYHVGKNAQKNMP